MTTLVWKNVGLYVDVHDFTTQMNQVSLPISVDQLDETVMAQSGQVTRTRRSGLIGFDMEHAGFVDYSDGVDGIDKALFDHVNDRDEALLVSIAPDGVAAAKPVFSMLSNVSVYTPAAPVGELLAFTVRMPSRQRPVRGSSMFDAAVSRTASFTSASQQLGAVGAAQQIVVALHVVEFTGTSLDVLVRSDSVEGMGTPTTVDTVPTISGVTTVIRAVDGPTTDDWWDLDLTFVGTSFSALMALGIAF